MNSVNYAKPISDPSIIDIGLDRIDEAAEVLASVFITYPVESYLFDGHGLETYRLLKSSFKMDCLWKLGLGWPLVGVLINGRLVAVELVEGIGPAEGGAIWYEGNPLTATRLQEMEERLNHTFGEQTEERILEYYRMREKGKPPSAHLYVESIATLPEYRGRGFAGMLLRYVDQLSELNPVSTGTALDTQDPLNLKIYGHLGYHVTGEADLGPVHTWFMFKPKSRIAE